MRNIALASLMILTTPFTPAVCSDAPAGTLFEYSVVAYADGGAPYIPLAGPPIVKVYKNGRVVTQRGDTYRTVSLSPARFRDLRRLLDRHPLLQQSAVYKDEDGGMAGLHGGFAFIRYSADKGDVYVVSTTVPSGGDWSVLVKQIQGFVPSRARLYYPPAVTLSIDDDGICNEPRDTSRDWPINDLLPLRATERPIHVEDAEVGRHLFERMYKRESLYMVLPYCSQGQRYLVYILGVPGFFGDPDQSVAGFEAQKVLRAAQESQSPSTTPN
jgi:hypothetical protein